MTPKTLAAAIGCTAARAELYAPVIDDACQIFKIDTPARLAAFLAQIGHESGALAYTCELASGDAYEGRASLGNTEPGDGRRYRGHGLIQLTGRHNHRAATNALRPYGAPDFEAEPDHLSDPRWAAMSAAWYWQAHGCNELADAGDFEAITRAINGGLNGLEDRQQRWERAQAALTGAPATHAPPAPDNAPQTPSEARMPIPAILAALLPTIVEAIPRLATIFKPGSAVAERNVKAAELVVDLATKATGAVNAQEAVEKLQADPVALQAARSAIEDNWWRISEAGGGGIEGARKADAAFMAARGDHWWALLTSPSFVMALFLLPLVYLIVLSVIGVLGPVQWSDDVRAALAGTIVGTIVGGLIGYYYGQTTTKNRTPAEAA
jgi:putative chitinase